MVCNCCRINSPEVARKALSGDIAIIKNIYHNTYEAPDSLAHSSRIVFRPSGFFIYNRKSAPGIGALFLSHPAAGLNGFNGYLFYVNTTFEFPGG